jgi:GNAT superfamily N-acetyltransferase
MVYYTDGRQEPLLDRAGLRALADLISDAFMEHDNWKRVVPEPARRKRALYALFSFMASVINRYGHIVVSVDGGRRVGYTTFMENADREQVSFRRILRCGALPHALSFLLTLKPRELASMRAFSSSIDEYHRGMRIDPRGLHLYTTAVEPSLKGRGIMKRGFAYAEERFKAAGFGSYMLETTDPANLPVYVRFGLTLTGQATMPGTGRSVWFFCKDLA